MISGKIVRSKDISHSLSTYFNEQFIIMSDLTINNNSNQDEITKHKKSIKVHKK